MTDETQSPPPPAELAVPVDRATAFKREIERLTPRAFFTPALIAINLAIFAIMVIQGVHVLTPTVESLIRWGGNFGPKTTNGEWWRLFTSMFLHIGILHVAMNMIVLWDVGRFVERLVGNTGFIALYLISGLAGSLASIAWNPAVVSAGASGAVFGIYGALVGFIVRERDTIPREVLTRLQRGAMAFVGYNLLIGLSMKGIDMAAHLGGLGGGFLCGLVLSHPLTTAGVAGRVKRALAVLAGGGLLIAGGALVMPKAFDLGAELGRLGKTEDQVINAYNGAVKKSAEGKLSDADFAKIIDEQVLPPWRGLRAEIGKLKAPNKTAKEFVEKYTRLAAIREEAWTELSEGLRTNDAAKVKQSQVKWAQGEAIFKEINQLLEKP